MRKVLILAAVLAFGCNEEPEADSPEETSDTEAQAEAEPRPLREVVGESTFEALPEDVELDMDQVLVGRTLFHHRGLSGDGTVSCATCHMLSHGGAEPRRTSTGIRGQSGPINSPTVLNAEHNFRQFWDGRAADLREQAAGPIANPIEMGGGDWDDVLARLREDEALVAAMNAAYGDDGVTQDNVLDAIVEYERSLATPSPFDAWLRGDDDALNDEQKQGLRTFVEVGCIACHRGTNLGGDSYQVMGAVNNYFEQRGGPITEADRGRFNVTQEESDMHRFKVPTLRNVALTAPYFHDGSEQDLGGAVRTMAHVQLGQELEDAQVEAIVAFLNALTGELPEHAVPPDAGAANGAAGETPPAGDAPEGATAD